MHEHSNVLHAVSSRSEVRPVSRARNSRAPSCRNNRRVARKRAKRHLTCAQSSCLRSCIVLYLSPSFYLFPIPRRVIDHSRVRFTSRPCSRRLCNFADITIARRHDFVQIILAERLSPLRGIPDDISWVHNKHLLHSRERLVAVLRGSICNFAKIARRLVIRRNIARQWNKSVFPRPPRTNVANPTLSAGFVSANHLDYLCYAYGE